jgi:hypothetical protein
MIGPEEAAVKILFPSDEQTTLPKFPAGSLASMALSAQDGPEFVGAVVWVQVAPESVEV